MSYNPDSYDGYGCMPTLFTKTANGALNQWTVKATGKYVCVRWGQAEGQLQTATVEATPKNIGRANETTAEQQAVLEAISQWKKKCKKKYYPSREEAKARGKPKAMLANNGKDAKKLVEKLHQGADVQPKLDGLRCLAYRTADGKVVLQSRGNDEYDVAHIQEALAPFMGGNILLDGELYIHGTSLQTITSLVRRPQDESVQLVYCIYDFVVLDDAGLEFEWERRRACMEQWFGQSRQGGLLAVVQSLQTVKVSSLKEVMLWHDEFVKVGYEGAIIRLPKGKYRFGYRSRELLKWKNFQEAEFPIVGFTNGKGKFEHYPIFKCRTGEGVEFDVMPKGTDVERRQMLVDAPSFIGKDLTVRFFDWTDDRVPHFPVGIAIRKKGT